MTERSVLPTRRPAHRRKFEHGNLKFFGTVSYFDEQFDRATGVYRAPDRKKPAEVFIDCAKATSDMGYLASAAAIFASLALQHGCPLSTLIGAAPKLDDEGTPAEPVGHFLKLIADGEV